MTLLDIFRAVVALAAPAWCPPSLAAASHEFARHRRDWVEGQAVRSRALWPPFRGWDVTSASAGSWPMASLWDGRATTLPTPRGQRGFPSRATLEQEAVFTPEVLALLFWSRAVVQWYWMGTTLPTADGSMELTAYEIQGNFPVRHRVVIENGIHLTLCDVERFFVQVLVMDFFAPVHPSDDGQSEGGSLPSTHSVFGTSEEVEVEVEVEVEDEAEEEFEEVEVESELEEHVEAKMKHFQTKMKRFEAKMKHFEANMKHFEAKMKQFEAKMQHFEAKIKHFEAKRNHFEAKMKRFQAKMKHFEAKMKHVEAKMKHFSN